MFKLLNLLLSLLVLMFGVLLLLFRLGFTVYSFSLDLRLRS